MEKPPASSKNDICDDSHLFTGGQCRFLFRLKMQNLGIGMSYAVQTCFGTHFGPFRPFLGRSPHRKVFEPKSTGCRNFCRKKCRFLTSHNPFVPFGCKYFLGRKFGSRPSNTFECRHKPLYSILVHLKLTTWQEKYVEISAFFSGKALNAPGKR